MMYSGIVGVNYRGVRLSRLDYQDIINLIEIRMIGLFI